MNYSTKLPELLNEIEQEIRNLELWRETPPDPEAFQSVNPFCYDSMSFIEWLQWVFIPRMRQTLAQEIPLSAKCEIAPAAEVYFYESREKSEKLIELLSEFDNLMPFYPSN